MAGLGQVDEHRLGSGGSQGGGDLARHVAGLAHPHADDAAVGLVEQLDRLDELLAERFGQAIQRLGFDGQHPAADADRVEVQHSDVVHGAVSGAAATAAGAMPSTGGGPEARALAALAAAVCCTGVWPNGPGERAPRPWGHTIAKPIIITEASPTRENSTRSDITKPIPAGGLLSQIDAADSYPDRRPPIVRLGLFSDTGDCPRR